MARLPAKLLLATAHQEIGNHADVVIVRRDEGGIKCYSTLDNDNTISLLGMMGLTMVQCAERKGKSDA